MYQDYGAGHASIDDCKYCPVEQNLDIENLTSSLYESFGAKKFKKSKKSKKSKKI